MIATSPPNGPSARVQPYGWGVETGAGRYRLRRRDDNAAFGHSAGPQSWKDVLHPERVRDPVTAAAARARAAQMGLEGHLRILLSVANAVAFDCPEVFF